MFSGGHLRSPFIEVVVSRFRDFAATVKMTSDLERALIGQDTSRNSDCKAVGHQLFWLCVHTTVLFAVLILICFFGVVTTQAYKTHRMELSDSLSLLRVVVFSKLCAVSGVVSTCCSVYKFLSTRIEPDWAALWCEAIGETATVDRRSFVNWTRESSAAATTQGLAYKQLLCNMVKQRLGMATTVHGSLWAHIRAVLEPPSRHPGDFFDACKRGRLGRLSKDEFCQGLKAGAACRPGSWPYFFVLGPQNQGKSRLIKQILQHFDKELQDGELGIDTTEASSWEVTMGDQPGPIVLVDCPGVGAESFRNALADLRSQLGERHCCAGYLLVHSPTPVDSSEKMSGDHNDLNNMMDKMMQSWRDHAALVVTHWDIMKTATESQKASKMSSIKQRIADVFGVEKTVYKSIDDVEDVLKYLKEEAKELPPVRLNFCGHVQCGHRIQTARYYGLAKATVSAVIFDHTFFLLAIAFLVFLLYPCPNGKMHNDVRDICNFRCLPAPCNITNSNLKPGTACACNDGYHGSIRWKGSQPVGTCTAEPCAVPNSNMVAGPGCRCADGYRGQIAWSGRNVSGRCLAASCAHIGNVTGSGPNCACRDGFEGTVTWRGELASGHCRPAPITVPHALCPAPGLCWCRDGFAGSIAWKGAVSTGHCKPAKCEVANADGFGKDCKCRDGFVGKVFWDGNQSSGRCTPAPCPVKFSKGWGNLCKCRPGYSGQISWNGAKATGKCTPASCGVVPHNNGQRGPLCECSDEYSGLVTWRDDVPVGSCTAAPCHILNSNHAFGPACQCREGFHGKIHWSEGRASGTCYRRCEGDSVVLGDDGRCRKAPCNVPNSNRQGGSDCRCKDGFAGSITWSKGKPSGACTPAPCRVHNSEGLGLNCKCRDSFIGDITWHEDAPRGTCTPVPCPLSN